MASVPNPPTMWSRDKRRRGSMAIYLSADLQINVFCGIWTFIILFLSPMNGIGISTPFTTIYHCRQNVFGRRFKDTLFRFTVCKWASSSALATCKISTAINPSKSLGHGQNWRLSDFKYLPSFDDQASRIRTKMATPSQAPVFSNLLPFKAHQPEWPELDRRRWGR